jgi:hypothetical protein
LRRQDGSAFVTPNGDLWDFDLESNHMDDRYSFRKKWLYIVGWMAILIISYLYITYQIPGFWSDPWNILRDAAVFVFFLFIWMAFFAQFVLPVRTFVDRQKIFDRLFRHLTGTHGPAIFIENGEIKEHSGEYLKKGPGVAWLDSASAAVIRTAVSIRKTIGPGVHFTESNEYIEPTGTLDLHAQSQKIGPKDGENPFDAKKDDQTKEQYEDIQSRRRQVSATSRDGIELVPDISISFRVDTGFPQKGKPGSRFGYRTGTSNEDKEFEREDKETILKAILGEGINPYKDIESSLHRVAWNRLPGFIAVDVWRDYASKFSLDELFTPKEQFSNVSLQPIQPTANEIAPLYNPTQTGAFQRQQGNIWESLRRYIISLMEKAIAYLEGRDTNSSTAVSVSPSPASPSPSNSTFVNNKKTALQRINDLVKARLTQEFVDELDEYGNRTGRVIPSEEYHLLQNRGIRVKSVGISNVRLHPTVQDQLIKSWAANWLKFAKDESDQLDLQQNLIETAARERAQCEYAKLLSSEIYSNCQNGNRSVRGLLMATLLRSRALIRSGKHSNSLRRLMFTELQDIEDVVKWLGDIN